ncbi:unnamed protein product, partial [Ectocarpus sp. 12 AP-2014]
QRECQDGCSRACSGLHKRCSGQPSHASLLCNLDTVLLWLLQLLQLLRLLLILIVNGCCHPAAQNSARPSTKSTAFSVQAAVLGVPRDVEVVVFYILVLSGAPIVFSCWCNATDAMSTRNKSGGSSSCGTC